MFYPKQDQCLMEPSIIQLKFYFVFFFYKRFMFLFCRSNLQRWQELADEKQQLTRTNLAAITAGTSTDDISDSSRTPPANNTRQPASS